MPQRLALPDLTSAPRPHRSAWLDSLSAVRPMAHLPNSKVSAQLLRAPRLSRDLQLLLRVVIQDVPQLSIGSGRVRRERDPCEWVDDHLSLLPQPRLLDDLLQKAVRGNRMSDAFEYAKKGKTWSCLMWSMLMW